MRFSDAATFPNARTLTHTGSLENVRAGVNVGSVADHRLHQLHVVHGHALRHRQDLGDENGNADLCAVECGWVGQRGRQRDRE